VYTEERSIPVQKGLMLRHISHKIPLSHNWLDFLRLIGETFFRKGLMGCLGVSKYLYESLYVSFSPRIAKPTKVEPNEEAVWVKFS
jgi:hypothetical protein